MKTPWHLWGVGILSLFWNAGGAYDYILTKTRKAEYIAQLSAEHIAYLDAFPAWVGMAWALGVWGAIAGSVLLLIRSRFAGTAFDISLAGVAGNLTYGLVLSQTSILNIVGPFGLVFTFAILFVAIFLWIYARQMTKIGVLK